MKFKIAKIVASIILASAICSCKKEMKNKSNSNNNLSYHTTVINTGHESIDKKSNDLKQHEIAVDTRVNWTFATVYMDEIVFEGSKNVPQSVKSTIGKTVNLFSTEPFADSIEVPEGIYQDAVVVVNLKNLLIRNVLSLLRVQLKVMKYL